MDIEKIECLETYTRNLKILYLQNNLIGKMEGLNKLKCLEYLNLAVNNIKKIEGIKFCESLYKLDLTLNFIDYENFRSSLEHLEYTDTLRELYLTGNPVTDWPRYKEYCLAKLPQLARIDGDDVVKSQVIVAKQNLAEMEAELEKLTEERRIEKEGKVDDPNAYTPEMRTKMYKELEEEKRKSEEAKKVNPMFKEYDEMTNHTPALPSTHHDDGRPRQCNQGHYEFKFSEIEEKSLIILEIAVPKHLPTSRIDTDVHPEYVRLDIKGKITQLIWPQEIMVEESKCERSEMTGELKFTCPTVEKHFKSTDKYKEMKKKKELEEKDLLLKKQQEELAKKQKEEREMEKKQLQERIDIEMAKRKVEEAEKNKEEFVPDFDISEVPDLE